jgi:hypothetical protein
MTGATAARLQPLMNDRDESNSVRGSTRPRLDPHLDNGCQRSILAGTPTRATKKDGKGAGRFGYDGSGLCREGRLYGYATARKGLREQLPPSPTRAFILVFDHGQAGELADVAGYARGAVAVGCHRVVGRSAGLDQPARCLAQRATPFANHFAVKADEGAAVANDVRADPAAGVLYVDTVFHWAPLMGGPRFCGVENFWRGGGGGRFRAFFQFGLSRLRAPDVLEQALSARRCVWRCSFGYTFTEPAF